MESVEQLRRQGGSDTLALCACFRVQEVRVGQLLGVTFNASSLWPATLGQHRLTYLSNHGTCWVWKTVRRRRQPRVSHFFGPGRAIFPVRAVGQDEELRERLASALKKNFNEGELFKSLDQVSLESGRGGGF